MGWQAAIDELIAKPGRVMVLGERDVGKSTFCEALLRRAAEAGIAARLVDADIGQKTVGPPACVTLGRMAASGGSECLALAFVGTVSPVQGWRRLMEGTERLSRGEAAGLVVVNTDGLVSGPGIRVKTEMIARAAPDCLVLVGGHPDLGAIAEAHSGLATLRLAAAAEAVRKPEGARRASRRGAFARYFAGASQRTVDLGALGIDGAPRLLALPRLLVGLTDRRGQDIALGLVTAHDPASGRLTVLTPAANADIGALRLGTMRLDEAYHGSLVRSADLQARDE